MVPLARGGLAWAGIAVALLAVGGLAYVADEPEEPAELGFAAGDVLSIQSPITEARREFRADVAVTVDMKFSLKRPWSLRNLGCGQRVQVTAVISGTEPLWRGALFADHGQVDQADRPGRSRVGVAVSDPVADLELRAASGDLAPLSPASENNPDSERVGGARSFKAWERSRSARGWSPIAGRDLPYVVRGGTMRRWGTHLAPIVVTFNAPWTSFRSLGSCYVRLPRLITTGAATAAYFESSPDLAENSGTAGLFFSGVTDGLTRLNTDGQVMGDQSEPKPTAAGAVEGFYEFQDATWACNTRTGSDDLSAINALRFGDHTSLHSKYLPRDPDLDSAQTGQPRELPGTALSDDYFAALEKSRSCQAVAVIAVPQADWLKALILLIAGAALVPLVKLAWTETALPAARLVTRALRR